MLWLQDEASRQGSACLPVISLALVYMAYAPNGAGIFGKRSAIHSLFEAYTEDSQYSRRSLPGFRW